MTRVIELAKGLKLPIEVITQRKTIIAKNRVGKSNTGCVYVEEVHGLDLGIQTVVLDPKGDWWGIKSSSDGKSKGLPFTIFGGLHGDIPINANSGKRVAEYLAANNVSVIIDVSEFSKGDVCRFGADFLQALYALWRRNRVPLNLVLEEADDFAPQVIENWIGPEQARCLSAVIQIAKKAGFLGIGLLCITQRCASLNKNVLTQSDVLFFMRTTSPQDIKAADEWLKNQDKTKREEVLTNISSLQNGEAYVFAPELGIFQRVQMPRRKTYDSGYTPKVGEKRVEPKVMADVDIARLSKEFAELIEKAKEDDPKALRARIKELERTQATKVEVREKVVEVEKPVPFVPKDVLKGIGDIKAAAGELWMAAERAAQGASQMSAQVKMVAKATATVPRAPHPTYVRAKAHDAANGLTSVQQRILDEMAELSAVGISEPDRAQLAFFCGYTNYKSGGFSTPLGALVVDGYVATPQAGVVTLTEAGQKAAKPVETPRTTEEFQKRLLSKMDAPRAKILEHLLSLHPTHISRPDLAAALGYTNYKSGGFSTPLGSLVALRMVETPGTGLVRASDRLFLEA